MISAWGAFTFHKNPIMTIMILQGFWLRMISKKWSRRDSNPRPNKQ